VRLFAAVFMSLLASSLAADAAHAGPGLLVGIDDDQIKWTHRPGPILGAVRALGVDAMRVTLEWRPGRRNLTGRDHTELRRAIGSYRYGVRVVLGVYGRPGDAPRSPAAREDYCRFCPERPASLRRDHGRRDLERSELRRVLAAAGRCVPSLRGAPRPLLGSPPSVRFRRERPDDDGREP